MNRIEKLKEFLEKDPTDSFVRHALALEYVKLGDVTMARRIWEELLAQDPAAVGSYYHLGKLLESLGEEELALEWYRKGMEAAKAAGEKRAYNELQGAYDELS
ncbi:MAG TPA: tetratricopeptide repeat protein [Puia sp.]|uniref:tetratricopeptide repeat protein n=1 Tax=Puia sp. TaxID=2045100 RepID=UPI002B6948EC|nr:tetratricopeptide repeat protein [Puia sp.]HVU94569.1 tetratricopeptide repeat protein [Puia sp.]